MNRHHHDATKVPILRTQRFTFYLKRVPAPFTSTAGMQNPSSPGILYMSPKRKRDADDSCMLDAPLPSRLRTTNLPTGPVIEQEQTSGGSPRTAVAGHLQGLDLAKTPSLDFHMGTSHSGTFGSCAFNPLISLPSQTFNAPVTPPHSSHGPLSINTQLEYKIDPPLEIPETPRLRPVASPTPPPSATKPKASKSPPPPSPAQALWWSDAEITGHDPKDPTDDGYGINGVGFLPTPAIANARAERRKKQLAEWKNREAREARQKRSDRRKRRDLEAVEAAAIGNETVPADNGTRLDEGRKVRFLEI